jgi:hypothetical protein
MSEKTQRIRDPLHDIIKFDGNEFEHSLWRVIQTRPFQRLRRIKQLGFSELIFPGATHTRFAHSIGVFHTARQLMSVIERHMGIGSASRESRARVAIAAALVHDVGHGMFSHVFEDVGKRLNIGMMRHEDVSKKIIQDSEIAECLNKNGSGFANDVATLIGQKGPTSLYDAVVSSQFDADRLDYIRRDRLMAGVQSGGIDFPWLIDNLEIGSVAAGVDDVHGGKIKTFVLGPKSVLAAEAYVLALFQLYPTIYFHKATCAAERVFSELVVRVINLIRDGHLGKTGLPKTHPLAKFAKAPDKLESVLALDDTIFWGALEMLAEATDAGLSELAMRMRDRKLPKCVDVRPLLEAAFSVGPNADEDARHDRAKKIERVIAGIKNRLTVWHQANSQGAPRIFVDGGKRDPYSRVDEKGPLNRIYIKDQSGKISDIADYSPMIATLEAFEYFRIYSYDEDAEARDVVNTSIADAIREEGNG